MKDGGLNNNYEDLLSNDKETQEIIKIIKTVSIDDLGFRV